MSQTETFILSGTPNSDYSSIEYVIKSLLNKVRTAMPVQVMSVSNSGGVSKIGTVSIKPLVGMIDASGVVTEHQTIYNVPYMRIQGGGNAIIIDPKVGDIGIALFCDRDISSVKASGSSAGPSSKRKHDLTDAIYLQSIISSIPTQYIQFNETGINIVSPTKVKIQAPACDVVTTGDTTITTTGKTAVNATGNVEITSAAIASLTATTSISLTAPAIGLNGSITQNPPAGGGAGTAVFKSPIEFQKPATFQDNISIANAATITHNGVNIGKDHKHSGVTSGPSNTGNPI